MPRIPAFRKQRQEDGLKFEASQGDIVKPFLERNVKVQQIKPEKWGHILNGCVVHSHHSSLGYTLGSLKQRVSVLRFKLLYLNF